MPDREPSLYELQPLHWFAAFPAASGFEPAALGFWLFLPREISLFDNGLFYLPNFRGHHSAPLLASALVQPGASFSFTFDAPGTYSYFCNIHPNMKGLIEVVQ